MNILNNKNKKFVDAIIFIYKNIDEPLDLETIAQHLEISQSTLKRLFIDATGISAGSFIRKLRMEQAFRSLQNKEISVLEIALQCGFEDHSAFARTFKEYFGYSPTHARKIINIVDELECITLEDPEFVEIESFVIQAITKQGLYFEIAPQAWDDLAARVNHSILDDDFTGTFIAIGHDNPHDGMVAKHDVRFSAGIAYLEQDIACEKITLTQGLYAKFHYKGKLNNMGSAYHYIYGAWLSKSETKIDSKKPAFMALDAFPKEFAEQKVAIYVPLISTN